MPIRPRQTPAQEAVKPERRHFIKRMMALVAGGALFGGVKQAFSTLR